MTDAPSAPRVVVLGATGATGRRVVALAAAAGVDVVAAGRRASALKELVPPGVEVRSGELTDADLRRLCAGAFVVVSAVGPSTAYGAVIIKAALRAGAHYVDFSGEPLWVHRLAVDFAARAAHAGCVLVPSVGLGAAGDLAAQGACGVDEEIRRLTVAYRIVGMRPSVATTRSTLEILVGGRPIAGPDGVRFVRAGGRTMVPTDRAGVGFPTPDPLVLRTRWPRSEVCTTMQVPLPSVVGPVLTATASALSCRPVLSTTRRALAAWARRPAKHDQAGGGRATATAVAEGEDWCRVARVQVDDVYDVTARAGLVAVQGLLAGRGTPGLAAWGSVAGDAETAAIAIGARLQPAHRSTI